MSENFASNRFPCPNCGGGMVYSAEKQALTCAYCGTDQTVESSQVEATEYRLDEIEDLATHEWGAEKKVLTCESCSGQTVIDISDLTAECVFCGSKRVVTETTDEGIKPETMVPFKIGRTDAKANISKFIKGKFYAPNALKSQHKVDALKSLYIPYFTYDSDTKSYYTGQRGDHYTVTKTRVVNGKTQTYTERKTRWRSVSGEYSQFYDDVLINASSKVKEDLISKMQSFNLLELEPYNEAYLVGHVAERYRMNLKDGWYKAKTEIDNRINQGIEHQVGGDEFRLSHKTTDYGTIMFKHILLPLWITSYPYKDKIYNVYINGQNGRVYGEYPKSLVKILLTILGVAAIVLIAYYFIVLGGQ
jgi:ribosomal protein S27AE